MAKPAPAIASLKAEPVPQTAKSDDGKEFLYATKVYSCRFIMLLLCHFLQPCPVVLHCLPCHLEHVDAKPQTSSTPEQSFKSSFEATISASNYLHIHEGFVS